MQRSYYKSVADRMYGGSFRIFQSMKVHAKTAAIRRITAVG